MTDPATAATPDKPEISKWESEGGSFKRTPPDPLPDGIIAETSVLYRVGPYSYSKYDDALAEHQRQSR